MSTNSNEPSTVFDLIIVYNSTQAMSPADSAYKQHAPFPQNKKYNSYNNTYAYFLKQCAQYNLRAAFATTDDITGEGLFRAVWTYEKKQWKRQLTIAKTTFVFDKFSVSAKENTDAYDLLNIDGGEVKLFHNRTARALFNNKWSTYKHFPGYAIPTAHVGKPTPDNIFQARKRLRMKMTANSSSESKKKFIIKDQFGAGGNHIYELRPDDQPTRIQNIEAQELTFIMQPRINASGFVFDEYTGTIDLRVIVVDGKIIQSYIRIAQEDEFRANASLGGEVVYIQPDDIPEKVATAVRNIHSRMPKNTNFYALDFIKNQDGNLFLVEGNITPGIIWFNEEDERYAKKLIRLIVKRIASRLKTAA